MTIEKEDSFIKQIALYLKNKDYGKSYELSKEFIQKFPNIMISHFLFAKSSFWLEKYPEAEIGGAKSFQLSKAGEEKITSGILLGTIYMMENKYEKAYNLMNSIQNKSAELEEILILCAVAMEDDKAIDSHIDRLYEINKEVADEFLAGMIEEIGEEESGE